MLKLLFYLIKNGCLTQRKICPSLDEPALGLPRLVPGKNWTEQAARRCAEACPTQAITAGDRGGESPSASPALTLDLGKCIGCMLCLKVCPSGFIVADRSTRTATTRREDLVLSPRSLPGPQEALPQKEAAGGLFGKSISVRVVSTGCSACDLEVAAAFNPIFDAERFGIHLTASPRMADVLLVTGPAGRGMHEPLKRAYEAMPEPRIVIAAGTCAISGGVHAGNYSQADGVGAVLPVDIFIPGCPPHPWSIIHGIMEAMRLPLDRARPGSSLNAP